MQSPRILQAVIIVLIVAAVSGCAASKEYSSKLFAPRTAATEDSQSVALKFLELDQLAGDQEDWVTTDIIKGKDTSSQTYQLDKLAKTFPATPDSTLLPKTEIKPVQSAPVARQANPGEVRTKKTRE